MYMGIEMLTDVLAHSAQNFDTSQDWCQGSAGRYGALGILLRRLEGPEGPAQPETASQIPQPFCDGPYGCPVQLGLGTGQTEIFNWGFGAQKGAGGVRFGYVQSDAGPKIGRGDPAKMSA